MTKRISSVIRSNVGPRMCNCHIDSCTLAYWLHYVFVILAALTAEGQIVHLKNVVLPVHVCGTHTGTKM